MLYKIWIDCIYRVGLQSKNKRKSIVFSVLIMSFFMAFNFFTIMMLVQNSIGIFFYELNISYFSEFVNYVLMLILMYFTPSLVVNLLFVRYNLDKLMRDVINQKVEGNFIFYYTLLTIFAPLIMFWIIWIWYLF